MSTGTEAKPALGAAAGSAYVTWDGTALDPRCCYCGRPVLGAVCWGSCGPYHIECVRPPAIRQSDAYYLPIKLPDPQIQIDDLRRRIEALERKLSESPNTPSQRPTDSKEESHD